MNNLNYFELMEFLENKEILKEIKNNEYECLLKNHFQTPTSFYNQGYGHLKLYINNTSNDNSHVNCFISSIDDSSICFHGPSESFDKAEKRLEILKELIKNLNGWIPTLEQCKDIANKSGTFLDLN